MRRRLLALAILVLLAGPAVAALDPPPGGACGGGPAGTCCCAPAGGGDRCRLSRPCAAGERHENLLPAGFVIQAVLPPATISVTPPRVASTPGSGSAAAVALARDPDVPPPRSSD